VSGATSGGVAGEEEPSPLFRPGPGMRLLAAVVLSACLGLVGGGLGAWAVYQHYGPIERVVTQEITGKGGQAETIGQLAQASSPSVVSILTQPATAQSLAAGGSGYASGVVVSSDGLILTSAHAVDGATQERVGLAGGQGFDATIVGTDTSHGLALLRAWGASGLTPIGLSGSLPAPGDTAVAISRPEDGGLSVGVGTVSAVGQTVVMDSSSGASIADAITIDATAEPEADGAPVLDAAGQLTGIVVTVTAATPPPGITALSLDAARSLIASVSPSGASAQGTFGADSIYLDPAHAGAAGLPPGALITSVEAKGPADAAGLKVGDIVTSVNGVSIDGAHPFEASVLGFGPDTSVTLVVNRAGTILDLTITVGTSG
jgi:S1-C subfamily serine protease